LQEKTCEEATSFDLSPYDVASAVSAVDRLLLDQAREEVREEDFNMEGLGSGQWGQRSHGGEGGQTR